MTKNKQKLDVTRITHMFPDDDTAEQWFVQQRWPDGVRCPHCGSSKISSKTAARSKNGFRCHPCRKAFTTKTNSPMASSNVGYRKWAIAIFLITNSIKGITIAKLARSLGITQKSAWQLAVRVRESYHGNESRVKEVVKADETYISNKERDKRANNRLNARRRAVGKKSVLDIKKRGSKTVRELTA